MKKYIFTEDIRESYPELMEKSFTEKELEKFYNKEIDHNEYKNFSEWFFDMLKSGLIIHR